jgi:hypothetical protein
MSKQHYFARLLGALFLSLAVVGLDASHVGLPTWFGVLALVPLLLYHASLARQRTRSSAEIDSVYYFGFLITVSALAATAWEIGRSPDPKLSSVLFKFALGLLATGVAVIARLHLQSKEAGQISESPEEDAARAARRATELLDNLTAAVAQVGQLTATAISETSRVSIAAQEAVRDSAREAAGAFKTEVELATRGATESLAQVATVVTDPNFANARQQFIESLAVGSRATRSAATALQTMAESAGTVGQSMRGAAENTTSVASAARAASEQLGALAAPTGPLTAASENMARVASIAAAAADSARAAAEGAAILQSRMVASTGALDGFATAVTVTTPAVEHFGGSISLADAAVPQLSKSVNAVCEVAEQVAHIGPTTADAIKSLQRLAAELEGINGAVAATGSRAGREMESLAQALAALTNELTRIARVIVQQTRERVAV